MMARAGEEIGVNLAVSLHAVTKEIRDEIVPINRKYGIEELLEACAAYPGANNARRITFEYVMLKDKNDSDERCARAGPADPAVPAAGQGQPDPVQPVARRALRMLDAPSGSGVQQHRLRGRHLRPGAHAARPRHRRGLRPAQDRGREEAPEPRGGLSHAGAGPPSVGPAGPRDLQRPVQGREARSRLRRGAVPAAARSIRRVHGDVTSMMVGGIAALLTQMLHPKALGGVWDHSDVAERPARPPAADRALHCA